MPDTRIVKKGRIGRDRSNARSVKRNVPTALPPKPPKKPKKEEKPADFNL